MIEIPEAFVDRLEVLDCTPGAQIVDQVRDGSALHEALLPAQPGQVIDYARLTPENRYYDVETGDFVDTKPVFVAQGFSEGILAKLPFAVVMANKGFETTFPDQSRQGTPSGFLSARASYEATRLQAMDNLSIIEARGEQDRPTNVVSMSYGSFVAEMMEDLATKYGWQCFDNSNFAMVAPMGFGEALHGLHTYPRLLKRFIQSGMVKGSPLDEFHDVGDIMMQAGVAKFKENTLRGSQEVRRIHEDRIDVNGMLKTVGKLSVIGLKHDHIAREAELNEVFETLPDEVVALVIDAEDEHPAYHADYIKNPSRTADVVAPLLV